MFNPITYEKADYFRAFSKSGQLLLERDIKCDIRLASTFLAAITEKQWLYTFNHLAGEAFQFVAASLCEAMNVRFIDFGGYCSINDLSTGEIWPIYNEIAEFSKLKYRTPQYFVGSQSFSSRAMTLEEMVTYSYGVYDEHYKDELISLIRGEPFYLQLRQSLS